jgi:hypothetical protein
MNSDLASNGINVSPSAGDFESLYLELLERYYEEGNREQARKVASRLEKSLAASPEYAYSIRGEEVRSIIAELRDDLSEAIKSREAEIRKILELHTRTLKTANWEYVSQRYGFGDVSDRLDLLAILYDKQGELDRAIAILLESKQYCEANAVPFDAHDLLDELKQAKKLESPQVPSQSVPNEILDNAIRRAYKKFKEPADEIVITDQKSRRFAAIVNRLLPKNSNVSIQTVKRRLLSLRRKGEARGGLPRLKRRSR